MISFQDVEETFSGSRLVSSANIYLQMFLNCPLAVMTNNKDVLFVQAREQDSSKD